jgi:hypothetical protein
LNVSGTWELSIQSQHENLKKNFGERTVDGKLILKWNSWRRGIREWNIRGTAMPQVNIERRARFNTATNIGGSIKCRDFWLPVQLLVCQEPCFLDIRR